MGRGRGGRLVAGGKERGRDGKERGRACMEPGRAYRERVQGGMASPLGIQEFLRMRPQQYIRCNGRQCT